MDRAIEEMTKMRGEKSWPQWAPSPLGILSTRPKDSVNCHRSILWVGTAWASSLQLLIEGSHDAVSWPRSCPVGHGENKAESDSKQVFMGEIGWKSRVFSQQFGQGPWGHHGSNPSTVRTMSLVKRDFLSSCPCKEREGLWTSAHQGTCLMKVTLPVLWTWNNCKLSIYKWSLLNPILHECWNACTTYKAESCWLRNIGL